jgi:hypothetical protein
MLARFLIYRERLHEFVAKVSSVDDCASPDFAKRIGLQRDMRDEAYVFRRSLLL